MLPDFYHIKHLVEKGDNGENEAGELGVKYVGESVGSNLFGRSIIPISAKLTRPYD